MKGMNYNWWEWGLCKLAIIAFAFFVIRLWPAAMTWVHSVNPWMFLIIAIVLGVWPTVKYFKN